MKVGIIGAGFAGVAAAQAIAKEGMNVTLFSAEKALPYFRQRLPEFTFDQEYCEDIFFNKLEWYAENGIDLRRNSRVKAFTADFEVSLEDNSQEKFNALIITTGASPVIPSFVHESSAKTIFPMWNYSEAIEIKKMVKSHKQLAIIGGGLIGIESALRADNNDLSITIIEEMPHLMSRTFGSKASEVIESELRSRSMDLLLNNGVYAIQEAYNNMIGIDMKDKDCFLCNFAILAVGAWFDVSMAVEAGLETDSRILVNEHLETSLPGIFAAGDIAQLSLLRPCSAEEASQQGAAVGQNVLAYLNGRQQQIYDAKPVPVHMKYKDFENYSCGEIPGIDKKGRILNFEDMKAYRNYIYENGALTNVQMSGSNKDSTNQKKCFLGKMWSKLKGN